MQHYFIGSSNRFELSHDYKIINDMHHPGLIDTNLDALQSHCTLNNIEKMSSITVITIVCVRGMKIKYRGVD